MTDITPTTQADKHGALATPGGPSMLLLDGMDGRTLAKAIAASNMFPTVTSEAQAIVKIQAGFELGIAPLAAIQEIHWIATGDGPNRRARLQLSGNLYAQLIKKRRPAYDFRVREHDDTHCVIDYLEDKEVVGTVEYTLAEAQAAGLIREGSNWKKYPRDMLFNRVIVRIARRYCPHLFGAFLPQREDDVDLVVVDSVDVTAAQTAALEDDLAQRIDRKKKRIFALCRDKGIGDEQRHADTLELTEGRSESLNDLDEAELDRFIEALKALPDAKASEPKVATSPQSPAESDVGGSAPSSPAVAADSAPSTSEVGPPSGWQAALDELNAAIEAKGIERRNIEGRARTQYKRGALEECDLDELKALIVFVGKIAAPKQPKQEVLG